MSSNTYNVLFPIECQTYKRCNKFIGLCIKEHYQDSHNIHKIKRIVNDIRNDIRNVKTTFTGEFTNEVIIANTLSNGLLELVSLLVHHKECEKMDQFVWKSDRLQNPRATRNSNIQKSRKSPSKECSQI